MENIIQKVVAPAMDHRDFSNRDNLIGETFAA